MGLERALSDFIDPPAGLAKRLVDIELIEECEKLPERTKVAVVYNTIAYNLLLRRPDTAYALMQRYALLLDEEVLEQEEKVIHNPNQMHNVELLSDYAKLREQELFLRADYEDHRRREEHPIQFIKPANREKMAQERRADMCTILSQRLGIMLAEGEIDQGLEIGEELDRFSALQDDGTRDVLAYLRNGGAATLKERASCQWMTNRFWRHDMIGNKYRHGKFYKFYSNATTSSFFNALWSAGSYVVPIGLIWMMQCPKK